MCYEVPLRWVDDGLCQGVDGCLRRRFGGRLRRSVDDGLVGGFEFGKLNRSGLGEGDCD